MEQLIFDIDNDNDAKLLISIAAKLGIKQYTISGKKNKKDIALFKIIDEGVDVSNFGNPINWQRQIRKDRNINPEK